MIDMELFLRFFLPIYIVTYILVLFVLNISSFKKKYQIDPRVVDKKDKLMYKFQQYRDLLFVFVILNIIIFSFFQHYYFLLVPIPYLDYEILKYIGVFVLIGSLILTRIAQIQLRAFWRIGIDRNNNNTALITTGIYKKSRNPIALGMLLSIIGFFLVLPNMTTFTMVILVHLIFSARIILEEEHLTKLHGKSYEKYRNRTRKWI